MLQKIKLSNKPKQYAFVLGSVLYFFGESYTIDKKNKILKPFDSKRVNTLPFLIDRFDRLAKVNLRIESDELLKSIVNSKKNYIGKLLVAQNGFYLNELSQDRNFIVSAQANRNLADFAPSKHKQNERRLLAIRSKENRKMEIYAELKAIAEAEALKQEERKAKQKYYAKLAREKKKREEAIEKELKQHAREIQEAKENELKNKFNSVVDELILVVPKTIDRINLSNVEMIQRYVDNKALKIKSNMCCSTCNKSVLKASKEHVFCSVKCKDNFWNNVNQQKFNNS